MADTLYADPVITCQWDILTPDVQEIPGGGCNLCKPPEEAGGLFLCTERCTGYPCGAVSRFVVSRSDGDQRFGWDGKHETCEEHLAEVVAFMIDGDETVHAVVAIRWQDDRPEAGR